MIILDHTYKVFENEGHTSNFSRVLSRNEFLKILHASNMIIPGAVAALIFQALAHNTALECLHLGVALHHHHLRVQYSEQAIGPLIESLPRMKGLKRLEWPGLEICLQHADFLPALHRNASIEELRVPHLSNPFMQRHGEARERICNLMTRNRAINQAKSILQPPPSPHDAARNNNDNHHAGEAGVVVIRLSSGVWHEAIVRLTRNRFGSALTCWNHV